MFSSLSSDGIRRRGFFRRISILSRFPSLEGGNSNNGDTLDDSRIIALLSGRALLGDDNGDIARYRDFLHGSGLDAFLEHVNGTTVSSRGSGPASRSAIQAMPVFKFGEKQDLNKGKAQRHGDCDSDHNYQDQEHGDGDEQDLNKGKAHSHGDCDSDHNYQDQEHGDGDGDGDDDDMHCAVCKEAFEIDVQVRKMPCQHMYHSDCILPWLALHSTCPICRREMRSESESESESEPESESEIHHHDHHHHLASREIRAMTDIRGIPYPGGRIRNRRRASRRGRRSVDRIGVGVGVAIVGDLGFGIHVHSVTLWGMENHGGAQATRIRPENPNAENPNAENPNAEHPNAENPNAENPNVENPNVENPNAKNPNAKNPNADRIGPDADILSSSLPSSAMANPAERPQIPANPARVRPPLEAIGTRPRPRGSSGGSSSSSSGGSSSSSSSGISSGSSSSRGNKLWNWVPMFGIQCCISMPS